MDCGPCFQRHRALCEAAWWPAKMTPEQEKKWDEEMSDPKKLAAAQALFKSRLRFNA